ncbi:MAG: AbrB/MazE/SpoVT family DNA-binding domain-containing protein [Nanoarchaeota archaeon]
MKTYSKTRTIGGSLVVTIPSNIVKNEKLKENEVVEIEVKKVKKDYFGALKEIGPFTEEDELKEQIEE